MQTILIQSDKNSFLAAVAPAILAVQAMVEGRFQSMGLVLPDRHVDPKELLKYLDSAGVEFAENQRQAR